MSTYSTYPGAKKEMEHSLTMETKLGRDNMQTWLRMLRSMLGVRFPKATLNFLFGDKKKECFLDDRYLVLSKTRYPTGNELDRELTRISKYFRQP